MVVLSFWCTRSLRSPPLAPPLARTGRSLLAPLAPPPLALNLTLLLHSALDLFPHPPDRLRRLYSLVAVRPARKGPRRFAAVPAPVPPGRDGRRPRAAARLVVSRRPEGRDGVRELARGHGDRGACPAAVGASSLWWWLFSATRRGGLTSLYIAAVQEFGDKVAKVRQAQKSFAEDKERAFEAKVRLAVLSRSSVP